MAKRRRFLDLLAGHGIIERHSWLLLILSLLVVSIGGLVEIVPLFLIRNTIEQVEGVRPYTPLELAGQRIYIREGCYNCHSQMVRSLRSEVDRYGHYSLAAESMYDRPFQWGSKRTGPDLARVGGKYSDDWHRIHMENPRAVVPESIMPPYPHLERRELKAPFVQDQMRVRQRLGDPYTDAQIEHALSDLQSQADPDSEALGGFLERWPDVDSRVWDADSRKVTELDALIAYLQMLGTLVDFDLYQADETRR